MLKTEKTSKAPVLTVGAIIPDAVYRLDELKARLGWRDAAFREAVRAGLKTHRSGKRLYVLGADLIAFITKKSPAASTQDDKITLRDHFAGVALLGLMNSESRDFSSLPYGVMAKTAYDIADNMLMLRAASATK